MAIRREASTGDEPEALWSRITASRCRQGNMCRNPLRLPGGILSENGRGGRTTIVKVTTEPLEHCRVVLEVEVEPERVDQAADRAFQRLASRVKVPGFRPGKAPRQVLRNFVGETRIRQETIQAILPEVYREAVTESGIKPFGDPEFEIVELDATKPFVFKATVPVEPVVKLGDYQSIAITPEAQEVTEEDIDRWVESTRANHAQWEPVERPAAKGDRVTVTGIASVAGDEVERFDQLELELGSGTLLAAVEEALVGAEPGAHRDVDVAVPEDYRQPRLAGRDATYALEVLDVKERRLPSDEELVALSEGVDSMDALRTRVRESMQNTRQYSEENRRERAALDELAKVSTIEYPSVLVDERVQRMVESEARRLAPMRLSLEYLLRAQGLTLSQYAAGLRPQAERRVRDELLLNALADAEGIEPSRDDVASVVNTAMASMDGERIDVDALERAAEGIARREKALHALVERALATANGASEPAGSAVAEGAEGAAARAEAASTTQDTGIEQ